MMRMIPRLRLSEPHCYLHLFSEPFHESSYDPQSGLYLIGGGHTFIDILINPKIQLAALQQKTSYLVEFDIYANPETLDMPLARPNKGVLSGFVPLNQSRIKSLSHLLGSSLLESICSLNKMKRKESEFLNQEEVRRSLGELVLNEYRDRNRQNPAYLSECLGNYTRTKNKVINFPVPV